MKSMLVVSILLGLMSCSNSEEVVFVKEYYFPYESFDEPITYNYYTSEADTQVWVMSYDKESREFVTRIDIGDFREITVEQISEEGAIFKSYDACFKGDCSSLEVVHDEVYKWEFTYDMEIVWGTTEYFSDGRQTTIKERSLLDSTSQVEFSGQNCDCIVFQDNYIQTIVTESEKTSRKFVQFTTYCKNIGLFELTRKFQDGTTYSSKLISID